MLGLSVSQIRSYVRSGFLTPDRGSRREFRFSFQDLVLLRTARELVAARVRPLKVRRALRRLREQLPQGRPITGVRIVAEGERVVVRDGTSAWNPESGQAIFNFQVSTIARKVAPIVRGFAKKAQADEENMAPQDWFELGVELETSAADLARDAYRRAIEIQPHHADAHINLGRLLHEAERLEAAEAHYRLALQARPDDPTASFNLAVALEDLDRPGEAIDVYMHAVRIDPRCADAHYNMARLYERIGKPKAALRHLKIYRRLTQGGG